VREPACDVARIVQQGQEAGPLNSSETEKDARVGFDEVGEEAEGKVGDHEEFEGVAGEEERRWSSVGGRWQKPHFSQRTREMGHPAIVMQGVLRLRRGFALRNLCSAQDDNSSHDPIKDGD